MVKMKYKKSIILLVLAVFLLSMTCVSASEIEDNIASEDTNTAELSVDNDIIEDNLQTTEENDELTLTDNDVLGADSATYSDLASEISQTGNIKLTHKNYTYNDGATAITIREANKVIDGDGAVIDMAGSTIRAFTISTYGVTIKNLTIKNANYNGNGGAIYFSGTGEVTNCNFTDNKATRDGGAVYFYQCTGSVTNCNFTDNTARYGGAIYFYKNGAVKKSYFKDNSANNYSDIYCNSELILDDNTFVNNETNTSDAINIANAKLTLSKTAFTYNTKVQKPTVTLTNGAVLKEGVDYTLQWSTASPKNAGTYTVTVTGIGDYTGTAKATFTINKAANPLTVKAKTATVKFSAVKKKAQTLAVSKVVTFSKKGQGTLTYAKASGNKKITIDKKTGKVTVGKGLKKGTYKVKVKIKAKGNANYKVSAFKTITFKIKIK